jgi:hypothetical protein
MNKDEFWLNNPGILIDFKYITQLWPTRNMSNTQKVNAIIRLVILLTILLYVSNNFSSSYLVSGFVTGVIITLYYLYLIGPDKKPEGFEGFDNKKKEKNVSFEKVNDKNPMSNVLVTDYTGNPNKKEAPPSYEPETIEQINKKTKEFIKKNNPTNNEIDKRLFKDLGDNYMFEDSMHRFYSNPSTTIPNDQEGFANFCYGEMVSAKEGNDFAAARNNPRYTNY